MDQVYYRKLRSQKKDTKYVLEVRLRTYDNELVIRFMRKRGMKDNYWDFEGLKNEVDCGSLFTK